MNSLFKPRFFFTCALSLCGSVLLGLGAVQAVSPHAHARTSLRPTPPDSYLQYKVYSVDQLIAQVSQNPVVRQRFARHFQIPESRVVSYMRANLVESYIPKTGHYTVYCVRRSGNFYPVKQTFKQGTKVFALRNGEPVMKWVCGNPLSRFLPAVQLKTASTPPPKVLVAPSIQELTPADTVSVLVPSDVATPVYQPLVPVSVAAASAPIFSAGGGIAGRSLLPLLLPVALVGVNTGGGHSNSPIPLPAVPETNSLTYVAAALPLMLLAGRRLRRSVR